MSKWSKHELEDMLEDVVNELDLFEELPAQHGTNGTAPAEMVRSVLNQKDREISMLKQGFVDVNSPLSHPDKLDIEGIRVKHLKFQRLTDDEITDLLIENNALREGCDELIQKWRDGAMVCYDKNAKFIHERLAEELDEILNKGVSDESKN